jgi:hypothetical protein
MPIEIRELVIRTQIADPQPESSKRGSMTPSELEALKRSIVEECLSTIRKSNPTRQKQQR